MRYQSVNRLFRVRDTTADYVYIAPTATAATDFHRKSVKGPGRKLNADELPADKIVRVTFNDCAEAIAAITGADQAALPTIRQSLQGMPCADEFVLVGRAAEQWARTIGEGGTKLLFSGDFA